MKSPTRYPLLEQINVPADLRRLSIGQLRPLAAELRQFLIQSISTSGGHLASSLGTVELTIALHYVFNTPDDRLVWDIGHQCYGHKVLTGRRGAMQTIRKPDGLSGFLKREESPYDAFGAGHSSTSISAALGMAIAARQSGSNRKSVAIIGDGGMTAGMAYEALNHAGHIKTDLLVILNDNDMSISPNVGALSGHFARLLSSPAYSSLRAHGKQVLEAVPPVRELARRTEEHVKGMVVPGTLFEEMGFNYVGPIDGHDTELLTRTLTNLRDLDGPRLLHIATRKGKGYAPAEANPVSYHGVSPFDPEEGLKAPAQPAKPTYTQIFSDWLCDMAEADTRLTGITPAMREGSGLVEFSRRYPGRYFDVGIAEQHAVTLAAGMACDGLRPVVAIYSTFLQRAYDQVIHDVALQNLPVLFAIDRSGLVGADGPTHAGSYDLTYLRCLPNLHILVPADENECRQMLYTAYQLGAPAAVRYPRGSGPGVPVSREMSPIPVGKGEIRRSGQHVALLAFGSLLGPALEAGAKLDATVVNMRFVKPLDEALVQDMARSHGLLVTLEENSIMGGAGGAVSEYLAAAGIDTPVIHLGLPDQNLEHGKPEEMLAACGLDAPGIVHSVQAALDTRRF
ncbi:MAG: 1-deoxy-D-xylulose-5-phosphate synthase [Gammaproteobacteria bacterium]|nr:1-deoxy-D-xylulose-5-phosphate synthase [Gammaproteobacteria bacterium]